ncbi:MAG: hypothetical protein KA955_10215 [Prevotella sp.]|nr:hypothetical protein [Prevotella sp.]
MASSSDYQKLWDNYQTIVKTKNLSIVDYCQRNGIVYSQFERWYKKYVSNVQIVPVSNPLIPVQNEPRPKDVKEKDQPSQDSVVEYVTISFINGLKVHQKSLDYRHLKMLVEKLEGLC